MKNLVLLTLTLICLSQSFNIKKQAYPYPWPITIIHQPSQIIVLKMTTTAQSCWKKNSTVGWWVEMLVVADQFYWQGVANFTNGIGRKYAGVHIQSVSSPANKTYKKDDIIQIAWSVNVKQKTDSYASDFTSYGPVVETRDLGYVKVQWFNAPYCIIPNSQNFQNQLIGTIQQKQAS